MKKIVKPTLLLLVIGGLIAVVLSRASFSTEKNPSETASVFEPETACKEYILSLTTFPASDASDDAGEFCGRLKSTVSGEVTNTALQSGLSATCDVTLYMPDTEEVLKRAENLMHRQIQNALQNTSDCHEVYDRFFRFRPEVLEEKFFIILPELMNELENAVNPESFSVSLQMSDGEWKVVDDGGASAAVCESISGISAPAEFFDEFKSKLFSSIEYIPLDYVPIDENAVYGYAPCASCFGESDNAEEISELLASSPALLLIGDEVVSWSESVQLAPGTKLRYYLDDSILVLVWNEAHGKFTETFSEVFIADASQFKRKLTDDIYHSETLLTVQELAKQTNAVLAESGDMSGRRNRNIGIFVYDREIYRFEPGSGDTCFIDTKGNLLFSHRGELSTREEAEEYISSNDILFSLCFGPVMIENGAVSVPDSYPWGEAYEDYMRNAFGQIGERHYLIYNSDFMTVSDAAEVMLQRGCVRAYALDGGFTACTVLNNTRINPIVSEERPVSDIICYVTAIPGPFEAWDTHSD